MSLTQMHGVANQKGGVGKTTVVMNLAAVCFESLTKQLPGFTQPADQPSPVLVASTDPQGSSVWWGERAERNGKLPFDYVQLDDPAMAGRERAGHVRESLAKLRTGQYRHVFVDTPGSLENEDILVAVLDEIDDVIVPMPPEPLAFVPTTTTIANVIMPRSIPFRVVINNWDPRDGTSDLEQTVNFIRANNWPLCRTAIRRYKLHTRAAADGQVCTQYPKSRVSLDAKSDFLEVALELGYGGQAVAA